MTNSSGLLNMTFVLVLFGVLAIAVATDLKSRLIPNSLLLPALIFAVLFQTIGSGVDGLIVATGGLILGLAMLFPLYVIGGMGAGDIKLLGVVGSFLGPWGAVVAGMATMMAGAVLGIAVIVWGQFRPRIDVHTTHFVGSHGNSRSMPSVAQSTDTETDVTHIPYAPAIAAGTVAALWYIGTLAKVFPGISQ